MPTRLIALPPFEALYWQEILHCSTISHQKYLGFGHQSRFIAGTWEEHRWTMSMHVRNVIIASWIIPRIINGFMGKPNSCKKHQWRSVAFCSASGDGSARRNLVLQHQDSNYGKGGGCPSVSLDIFNHMKVMAFVRGC
mmetsp:Transcript_45724/g.110792  ORF Transcript_45724/g.110792 Transcript_45724/m.110792 type:complete len:138 (+) Transcript_45724:243-656(+)